MQGDFFLCSRLTCVAFCSFSSAAHLVGCYAKEMESIIAWWVMLFTGKTDDHRQGITPSWSDVSWKIPLFHREEGKVQRTLEMVATISRNLCAEREEDTRKRYSPRHWERNVRNVGEKTCTSVHFFCTEIKYEWATRRFLWGKCYTLL